MYLNRTDIKENKQEWLDKGYNLPTFDYETIKKNTLENPVWIHFGAGNIFRAFQCVSVQKLLNENLMDTGLIALGEETYKEMCDAHDNLSITVTLKSDGSIDKTVVGSIAEALNIDELDDSTLNTLVDFFKKDSLQMCSFTITEKGYNLYKSENEFTDLVKEDIEKGPSSLKSYFGRVTSFLYERYKSGKKKIAMVSMDNCSHNGDKLKAAVTTIANKWYENKFVEKEFVDYLNDENHVSFPWSMIDKITPRPDDMVKETLLNDGILDLNVLVTKRQSYIAPFVNAEETEYLVIEDKFPNGRPPLEKVGIMFTDKETVDKVEKMKVCTCLNPLHTSLAIYGCLLDYTKISDELKDEDLKKLIEIVGYKEGLPVVVDPKILNPKEFIDTVINVRLTNPFMPDTPQRIAMDTSQKLPIRFGETIKAYIKSDTLNVNDLKLIPLVFAGWLRYLMGVDDNGQPFELSSDPLLDELLPYFKDMKLGDDLNPSESLKDILTNEKIFGVNLCEVGLDKLVCNYFIELTRKPGSVRETLHKYVNQ